MDEGLLGRAVEYHGPDFLRQLQLEQEQIPPNIFLHLQKHRPQAPEISDSQFILNVRRFVSKKADILFRPGDPLDKKKPDPTDDEDSYAKMPPVETFMGIDQHTCRKHLHFSFEIGDIVIGVVSSIVDSGLVLQLLCMEEGKNRDIDDLNISAFIPSKEIPKMFPTQNPVEGYQVKDYIRGIVINANPDSESVILSLMDRREIDGPKTTLGLIHDDDFPVQYRRKLHIRGLTFDELVNSILGFANPGNVPYLLSSLRQRQESSLMRGLYRLKVPEKEYADSLKKQQSQKWAYQCVAEGVAFFKEGKQTEAMQKLNKALSIDSTNVEALVARGALYANTESYTRALADFEAALTHNSKHPNAIKYMHETLLAKGKGHEDEREFDEAGKCYNRALEIVPDSREARESLRYVQYKADRSSAKVKRERTPSPPNYQDPSLPFKETTDTLKKLIRDEQRSKKKSAFDQDSSEEKSSRRRSKKKGRRSSSSSSSDSRSRSKSHVDSRSRSQQAKESYDKGHKKSRSPEYVSGQVKSEAADYYNFSRKNDKIPGLGDSPPADEGAGGDVKRRDEKKEFDLGKGYNADREMHDREKYVKMSHFDEGDRRRSAERREPKPQRDVGQYPRRSRSLSREREAPPVAHKPRLPERQMSVTPTKDEVSDRLGLEDISPEEHDPRNDDYRFRLYGNREGDHKFREYVKRPDSFEGRDRSGDRRRSRSRSRSREKYRREERRYSPDKRRESQYSPDRRRESFEGRRESFEGRRESFVEGRRGEPYEKYREMYERPGGHEDKRRNIEEDYHERRIVSVSKREKKPAPAQQQQYYESMGRREYEREEQRDERDGKMEHARGERDYQKHDQMSPGRTDRRRESSDMYYESGTGQEKRSIMVGQKKGKEVITPQRYDEYSGRKEQPKEDWQRATGIRRSESPRYKQDGRYERQSREDQEYQRKYSPEESQRREIKVKQKSRRSYSRSRSRSRSPFGKRRHESYDRQSREKEEESYSRVIAVKPKDVKATERDNREIEEEKTPMQDIFADLPQPKNENAQSKFSTYVPRSVKLKHHPEKGLNPESLPSQHREEERKVRTENGKESRTIVVKRKPFDDDFKPKFHQDPHSSDDFRFKFRPKTPEHKKKYLKNRSRSRSSSKGRYRKSSGRSKETSRRSRSRSSSRGHSRKRSRSHDRYRKRSRSKSRDRKSSKSGDKGSRRSRSSSSSSSEDDRRTRKTVKQGRSSRPQTKPEVLPKISSRWDSPQEKKSRWEGPQLGATANAGATLKDPKQDIDNFLSAYMISRSPPPHRSMKPEERKALQKKWKELSVSPLPTDDEEDSKLPINVNDLVKLRAAEVAARLSGGRPVPSAVDTTDGVSKNIIAKAKQNVDKLIKLKGIKKSKWDSGSESDTEVKTKSKKDKKRRSRSRSRSTNRSKDKRSRSRSRSKGRKKDRRSRSRGRRSKSRSRDRSRSRSKSRRDRRSRSRSKDRRRSNSAKGSKDDKKVFWFHKNDVDKEKIKPFIDRGFRGGNRGALRGNRGRGGRGRGYGQYGNSKTDKSKWSSDESESSDDEEKRSSKPKESLNELEEFYNKLKSDKKRKTSTEGPGNSENTTGT